MDHARVRGSQLVAVALAYYGLSRLGLAFIDGSSHVAAVWPAGGVMLGVFLLSSPRRWPELAGAVLLAGLVAQAQVRGLNGSTAVLAVGDALGSLLAAAAWRGATHGQYGSLTSVRGLGGLALAALGASAVTATLGATVAAGMGAPFGRAWMQWWIGGSAGMLVLAPVTLAVARHRAYRSWPRVYEPAAAMALTLAACTALFLLSPARGVLTLEAYIGIATLMSLAAAGLVVERRRAAARERTERERLGGVLRAATEDSIVATDLDGTITLFNDGAERMLGYTAAELVGRVTPAVFHDPQEVATRARELGIEPGHGVFVTQARRGTSERRDWTFIRKDGSRLTVLLAVSPIQDADGAIVGFIGVAHDVTRRRQIERDLATAERRSRDLYEHAPIGMGLTDLRTGKFIDVNPALCAITGYTRGQLRGSSSIDLDHPDERGRSAALRRALMAGEIDHFHMDKRYVHANGKPIDVSVHVALVRDGEGRALHMIGQVLDITERKRFEDQLRHLADHDPLTGLLNRRRLEQELARHIEHVRRRDAGGALMVLDIDNFKQVNDTLGHRAGDELIVSVARILSANLRSTDVLARLGGDEFAILLPRADAAEAKRVATKLVRAVRAQATVVGGARPRTVTISLGATMFRSSSALSEEELMVEADLAMYDAKAAGRNAHAFYGAQRGKPSQTKAQIGWLDRLERALDTDGFVLDAQPILDLRAGRVTQHELLIRMLDDHGTRIRPAAFLDIAERYDMVGRIDQWVANQAIELLSRAERLHVPCRLELNLSGHSIGDRHLLDAITRSLRATAIDPSNLIFEVTETAAVADIQKAQRFARALRELGCHFALDDFGAGFGSFYYLKHLPFDYLKIDGEFIERCREDQTDQLVIQAVVQIAQGLGKDTIAELVPDAATQRLLRRLGVDYVQGHHVGAPVPLEQALPELFGTGAAHTLVPARGA